MKNSLLSILTAIIIAISGFTQESHATPLTEEIRVGVLRHDLKSWCKYRHEHGYDVNLEYLFATPCNSFFDLIFSPRPHLGMSINTIGKTNQFYTGLTWHVDLISCLFLECSLGGEIHNAKLKHSSKNHNPLGSRLLFRESIALGIQICTQHSLSIMLDHASNANLAFPNRGLTSFGIRYGYLF